MLAGLSTLVDEATRAFDDYDHAKALDATERFFWNFTDDYLELVKSRAYGDTEGAGSAIASLRLALSVLLRLFAPFLPYVTEEVWSWWQEGSVHLAAWPTTSEIPAGGDPAAFEVASWSLKEIRGAKTRAKRSLRADVERVVVRDTAERLAALARVEHDVREAGNVSALETATLADGEEPSVEVTLPAE
jgi:valyl-tRNA synthetase